ncbi:retrovirus-related pol polyprotein from transposon TNT 1-94 [Tanacetum coccineum]
MLDKIWEYCKDVHRDSTYWWHDHGFEEKEHDEMGIEIEKYDPPEVLAAREQLSRQPRLVVVWYVLWKPSRDFTRPLGPPSGLKGLLHMLNATVIPTKTSSLSRTSSPYYVTHPSVVVDYDDDYQGDTGQNNSDDPLTFAMILLARAIIRNFSNLINNHLCTSSNTRNQAIVQGDNVNIQRKNSGTIANVQCYNCYEKGHYARNCPKPRIRDLKYFMEHMLLAKQDEAGVILTNDQNDFLFADVSRMEEIKELSTNICLMNKIQPANIDGSSNDYAFLSGVQTSSTSYVNPLFAKDNQEQKYLTQSKIINKSIGDDQIDSNIIFDEPNEDVNSGNVENDNNVQDSYELEQLARNTYKEANKQQIIAKKVQQQNIMLTKQLELYKEKVQVFEITKEKTTNYFNEYIEADQKAKQFEQESQSQFIRDRYII